MRKRLIPLALITAISLLASCGTAQPGTDNSTPSDETPSTAPSINQTEDPAADDSGKQEGRLQVVASFHAMEAFAEAVGGDLVEVSTIVPAAASAHSFEPRAMDLVALNEADVFIYNGQGMESWLDQALEAVESDELVLVDTSEGLDVIVKEEDEHEHDHDHDEDEHDHEGHSHGPNDPHLWLGLTTAIGQVNNIRDAFVELDPENAEQYTAQAQTFTDQLQALLDDARTRLEGVEQRHFVTGHAAFGYLCRDLDLEQSAVQGIYAEGEPSAQQLSSIVEAIREEGVTVVFTENQASPAVSEALANEIGAETVRIYTMESAEDDLSFLERVEFNLDAIIASLAG